MFKWSMTQYMYFKMALGNFASKRLLKRNLKVKTV